MKVLILAFTSIATLSAADTAMVWKAQDVTSKLAATKPDAGKITQDSLGHFAGYSMTVTKRDASGTAEVHKRMNDIFVAQEGECTLVTGGTIVNPKNQSATEVRGASIQGGTRRKVSAGDVVHIPANIPHQMLLEPGKSFVYAVVKTEVR